MSHTADTPRHATAHVDTPTTHSSAEHASHASSTQLASPAQLSTARAAAASNTNSESLAHLLTSHDAQRTAITTGDSQLAESEALPTADCPMGPSSSTADSAKSPARLHLQQLASNSTSSTHANSSSSSAPHPISFGPEYVLLAASSSTDPAPTHEHPSTSAEGTFALAVSSRPAVVAPAGPSSSSSISTRSAPTTTIQSAPASASLSLHADALLLSRSDAGVHPQSLANMPRAPRSSSSRSVPAAVVAANALLAAAFEVPIVSASASPSASLETKCQCLVVDESRLVPDTSDFREFRQAMDSSADRVALLGYVRQWLRDTPHDDLIVAHVPHGPRESAKLHINFASFEALGRALARFPFLVRCGSMGTVSSWNTTPCGLPRHECPEMLSFSVNTLTQGNPKDLDREVTRLLKEMDVDYTAMWFTSATILAGSNSNRKAWSVLVRRVDKLSELVHRLHHHHTLWGGKIRVHAPNSPKLIRCTQCDQLGHHVNKCTIYDGLAVRFLFKETASYHAVQQLVKMVGARAGFLGSGMEEVKPSRRVTLLFDAAEKDLSVIIGRVREVAGGLALHVNPYAVDVKDRQRECRECGDMTSPHECPFSNFKPKAMSHVLNIASRSLEEKDMCHAWFTDKFCPRRDRGDPCPFKHPPEHVAQSGTRACHQFRANGHCSRGASCPLKHAAATVAAAAVSPPVASAVSPVVAAEPPATAAVVAPAASPSKKRRAKAVEEDEESKDAVVPSSAKKSRQVATRTLTKVTPKSSGGRFAALQASSDDAMDDDDAESKSPPPPRTPPTARRTMSSSSGRAAPSSTPISSLGSISSPQPSPSRTSSSTKKNKPSSSAASSQ